MSHVAPHLQRIQRLQMHRLRQERNLSINDASCKIEELSRRCCLMTGSHKRIGDKTCAWAISTYSTLNTSYRTAGTRDLRGRVKSRSQPTSSSDLRLTGSLIIKSSKVLSAFLSSSGEILGFISYYCSLSTITSADQHKQNHGTHCFRSVSMMITSWR